MNGAAQRVVALLEVMGAAPGAVDELLQDAEVVAVERRSHWVSMRHLMIARGVPWKGGVPAIAGRTAGSGAAAEGGEPEPPQGTPAG
jgi:hypothetical protein